MLISNQHGFLFVHIVGTGGRTIRSALEPPCGANPRDWIGHLARWWQRTRYPNEDHIIRRHAPVIVAHELLPARTFHTLFKFSFVRNPWDRLVGVYRTYRREHQELLAQQHIDSFPAFVDAVCVAATDKLGDPRLRMVGRPQLESLIGLHGELLVDFVGRYENFRGDFRNVCSRLALTGIAQDGALVDHEVDDYRSYYTDQLAERIARHFADDLAAFQYRFDPRAADKATTDNKLRVDAIAGKIHP